MNRLGSVCSYRDLMFVVESLIPTQVDTHRLADLLQEDEHLLEAMLEDPKLFTELMAHDDVFLTVSPPFFFQVLLSRARQDLQQELLTFERRHAQKVALFDASQVAELLGRRDVSGYLASMLASFTRIESLSVPVRVRPGIWRRIRINDLDIDSLVQYAQILDEEQRFWAYQRIADACLLLTGFFPEAIDTGRTYQDRHSPTLRLGSSLIHDLEDHENVGRAFYRLAAKHKDASLRGLEGVLSTLSDNFVLVEKPLAWISSRYLSLRKHKLFDL